jgi:DNA-binding winged helix-turn-helix (wHTH) protein
VQRARRHDGCHHRSRAEGAALLLDLLLGDAGRMVPIEALRRALWGDSHLEWRNGIHRCVRDLRAALGDDARHPRFVATVARLGYRFVGERTKAEPAAAPAPARERRRHTAAFAAGFVVALTLPLMLLLLCVAAAVS